MLLSKMLTKLSNLARFEQNEGQFVCLALSLCRPDIIWAPLPDSPSRKLQISLGLHLATTNLCPPHVPAISRVRTQKIHR